MCEAQPSTGSEVRIGAIGDVGEIDFRHAVAEVPGEAGARLRFPERLRAGLAVGLGVADLAVQGQRVAGIEAHIEIERLRLGLRVAQDGVVHHAPARRRCCAKVPPTSVPSLDGGVGGLFAGAEHVREPRHVVVVEVVGLELGVQAGEIDVERVRGPELQAEVRAGAHALLLEQRRTEQVWHGDRRPALIVDDAIGVAQEFDAVAAQVAFLVDAGDQHADRLGVVLPAEQRAHLRIGGVGEFGVRALQRGGERGRRQIQRIARLDVHRAADAAFLEVGLRALVDLGLADDLGGQHQVVEAAGRGQLVEHEPVGGGDAVAIQLGAVEVGRRAADRNALALAEFP